MSSALYQLQQLFPSSSEKELLHALKDSNWSVPVAISKLVDKVPSKSSNRAPTPRHSEVITIEDSQSQDSVSISDVDVSTVFPLQFTPFPVETTCTLRIRNSRWYESRLLFWTEKSQLNSSNSIRFGFDDGNSARTSPLGKLPERYSSCLFPLLDEGLIALSGSIISGPGEQFHIGSSMLLLLNVRILESQLTKDLLGINKALRDAHPPLVPSEKHKQLQYALFEVGHMVLHNGMESFLSRSASPATVPTVTSSNPQLLQAAISGDVFDAGSMPNNDELLLKEEEINELVQPMNSSYMSIPESKQPSRICSLSLRPYQLQAVSWMLAKEGGSSPVQRDGAWKGSVSAYSELTSSMWESGRFEHGPEFFLNPYTRTIQLDKGEALSSCGGVLADEMGLGKSVEFVALCAAQDENSDSATDDSIIRATLIVAPVSMLGQWKREIEKYSTDPMPSVDLDSRKRVKPSVSKFKVFLHYGDSKSLQSDVFSKFDFVVTSYGSVTSEFQSKALSSAPLFKKKWLRVALDEAHVIRNSSTIIAQACYAIKSKYRWALTGTPIQNSLQDLHSLVRFLNMEPWVDTSLWKKVIAEPYERKEPKSIELLKGIISHIILRRTKNMTDRDGKKIGDLPLPNSETVIITLSKEDRTFYDLLFSRSKAEFRGIMADRSTAKRYSAIFALLIRLRQACNHPYMVLGSIDESKSTSTDSAIDFWQELADVYVDVHKNCRIPLKDITRESVCNAASSNVPWKLSTKFQVLMSYLDGIAKHNQSCRELNKDIVSELKGMDLQGITKSVVFSYFTFTLDLLERELAARGIGFSRLDGSINQSAREAAIEGFHSDSKLEVMLLSLNAGGVGINLQDQASICFILDPWFNPAVENQAIGRVHRFGQKKQVYVKKFICEDSVERGILAIQERKTALVQNTLDDIGNADLEKLSLQDLQDLFKDKF
jgi:DNA repair protein RAD5